jgi:hypothetical protein
MVEEMKMLWVGILPGPKVKEYFAAQGFVKLTVS